MAGITNITNTPSDKRGLGLTFLGMMKHDIETFNDQYDEQIEALYKECTNLRKEIVALRIYVMTPWYKKAWAAIVKIFRGGDNE